MAEIGNLLQTIGVSAAHATHCATYCTPCRPLIRAFSGWIRTPPPNERVWHMSDSQCQILALACHCSGKSLLNISSCPLLIRQRHPSRSQVLHSGLVLVRSHVKRRCSILGPTQSRMSPSMLQYTKKTTFSDLTTQESRADWLTGAIVEFDDFFSSQVNTLPTENRNSGKSVQIPCELICSPRSIQESCVGRGYTTFSSRADSGGHCNLYQNRWDGPLSEGTGG